MCWCLWLPLSRSLQPKVDMHAASALGQMIVSAWFFTGRKAQETSIEAGSVGRTDWSRGLAEKDTAQDVALDAGCTQQRGLRWA